MEKQQRANILPAVFAAALAAFGITGAAIRFFGYMFVPYNEVLLCIGLSVPAVFVAVSVLRNRNGKPVLKNIPGALLPLLAIFFIVSHGAAAETTAALYRVQAAIIFISSIVICISLKYGKTLKICLKILYGVLAAVMVPLLLFAFSIALVFSGLRVDTVVQSTPSPGGGYLAEVINSDQGALGGNTLVRVRQHSKDIHLFIGVLQKDPQTMYTGEWGEFEGMTLRWEDEETLCINETRYRMQGG